MLCKSRVLHSTGLPVIHVPLKGQRLDCVMELLVVYKAWTALAHIDPEERDQEPLHCKIFALALGDAQPKAGLRFRPKAAYQQWSRSESRNLHPFMIVWFPGANLARHLSHTVSTRFNTALTVVSICFQLFPRYPSKDQVFIPCKPL